MSELKKVSSLSSYLSTIFIFLSVITVGFAFDFTYNRDFIKSLNSFEPFFDFFNFLGLGGTQILLLFSLALLISRLKTVGTDLKWRTYKAAHAGILAVIFSGLLAQLLKYLIGRPRPRLGDIWGFAGPTVVSGFNSFPSGHTVTSFALAAVMSRYFPSMKWVLFIMAGFIAVSRIGSGSHYPSDVAGGMIFGIIFGNFAANRARRYEQKDYETGKIVVHHGSRPVSYSVYLPDREKTDILKHAIETEGRFLSEGLMQKNDGPLPAVQSLYHDYDFLQSGNTLLVRIPYADSHLYFKAYYYDGMRRMSPLVFYPSKSLKFFFTASRLSELGITVPGIIAFGEVKDFFLLKKSFVFLEEMKGSRISGILLDQPLIKKDIIRTSAIGFSSLHRNGIYYCDTDLKNIFWNNGKMGFFDLDTFEMRRKNDPNLITRDLGMLNDETLAISIFGRLRFFIIYLKESPDLWPKRKTILKEAISWSMKAHAGWKDKGVTGH